MSEEEARELALLDGDDDQEARELALLSGGDPYADIMRTPMAAPPNAISDAAEGFGRLLGEGAQQALDEDRGGDEDRAWYEAPARAVAGVAGQMLGEYSETARKGFEYSTGEKYQTENERAQMTPDERQRVEMRQATPTGAFGRAMVGAVAGLEDLSKDFTRRQGATAALFRTMNGEGEATPEDADLIRKAFPDFVGMDEPVTPALASRILRRDQATPVTEAGKEMVRGTAKDITNLGAGVLTGDMADVSAGATAIPDLAIPAGGLMRRAAKAAYSANATADGARLVNNMRAGSSKAGSETLRRVAGSLDEPIDASKLTADPEITRFSLGTSDPPDVPAPGSIDDVHADAAALYRQGRLGESPRLAKESSRVFDPRDVPDRKPDGAVPGTPRAKKRAAEEAARKQAELDEWRATQDPAVLAEEARLQEALDAKLARDAAALKALAAREAAMDDLSTAGRIDGLRKELASIDKARKKTFKPDELRALVERRESVVADIEYLGKSELAGPPKASKSAPVYRFDLDELRADGLVPDAPDPRSPWVRVQEIDATIKAGKAKGAKLAKLEREYDELTSALITDRDLLWQGPIQEAGIRQATGAKQFERAREMGGAHAVMADELERMRPYAKLSAAQVTDLLENPHLAMTDEFSGEILRAATLAARDNFILEYAQRNGIADDVMRTKPGFKPDRTSIQFTAQTGAAKNPLGLRRLPSATVDGVKYYQIPRDGRFSADVVGRWIPANDFNRIDQVLGGRGGYFEKFIETVKRNKIVYNPASHFNAWRDDSFLQALDGGGPRDLVRADRVLRGKGMDDVDKLLRQEFLDRFVAGDYVSQELIGAGEHAGDFSKGAAARTALEGKYELLDYVNRETIRAARGPDAKVRNAVGSAGFDLANAALQRSWMRRDYANRYAYFRREALRALGMDQRAHGVKLSDDAVRSLRPRMPEVVERATDYAYSRGLDYQDMPQWMMPLRATGIMPFAAFQSASGKLAIEMLTQDPKLVAAIATVMAARYADRQGHEIEDELRRTQTRGRGRPLGAMNLEPVEGYSVDAQRHIPLEIPGITADIWDSIGLNNDRGFALDVYDALSVLKTGARLNGDPVVTATASPEVQLQQRLAYINARAGTTVLPGYVVQTAKQFTRGLDPYGNVGEGDYEDPYPTPRSEANLVRKAGRDFLGGSVPLPAPDDKRRISGENYRRWRDEGRPNKSLVR